ncbi:MAG: hypothetical protein HEEMFOPI_01953 [Holosporales bacterium]
MNKNKKNNDQTEKRCVSSHIMSLLKKMAVDGVHQKMIVKYTNLPENLVAQFIELSTLRK